MGPSAAIRLPVASKATESTNPSKPRNSLKPDPATGRTSTLPDLVPVARNWPSGEAANWDTSAAICRRGKPLTVEGQISTPPLPADAAIHFPSGSNAPSLGRSAATRRTEGQRRVAGQNVTPFRSSAVSHRPIGSNVVPIVVTTPRPSTIGSASGGPVRSHIRNPCLWRAATSHWLMRSNATPVIRSSGLTDEPVSCRGSLARVNEPTRAALPFRPATRFVHRCQQARSSTPAHSCGARFAAPQRQPLTSTRAPAARRDRR